MFQYRVFLILSPVFFQKRKTCFTCLTIPIKIVSLHNHLFFSPAHPILLLPCFADYISTQPLLLKDICHCWQFHHIYQLHFSPINTRLMSKGKYCVLEIAWHSPYIQPYFYFSTYFFPLITGLSTQLTYVGVYCSCKKSFIIFERAATSIVIIVTLHLSISMLL